MKTNVPNFEMVGYRFFNLRIDEGKFHDPKGEKGLIEFSIGASDPKVSETQYQNRKVIELAVTVKALQQGGADESFLHAECIAGFLGQDKSHDGDVEHFSQCATYYVRSLYWLIRQRLASLLTMTRFRQLRLPADLDLIEVDSPKRSSSSGKKTKNIANVKKPRKAIKNIRT
jgi:hypothetical protein